MTNSQSKRLFSYHRSQRLSRIHSQHSAPSKRSVKNNGSGVGQVLKSSKVRSEIMIGEVVKHTPIRRAEWSKPL